MNNTTDICYSLCLLEFGKAPGGEKIVEPGTAKAQIERLKQSIPTLQADAANLVVKLKSGAVVEKDLLANAPADIVAGIQAAGGTLQLLESAPNTLNNALDHLQRSKVVKGGAAPVAASCTHWLIIYLLCIGTGPLAAHCGLGAAFGYANCKLG